MNAPIGIPVLEWVDPTTLLVDETYQRDLSRKSLALVERIVARWDWSKFKPPICSRTAKGLFVIDGQHTALGAATNTFVDKIPVLVVDAATTASQAAAFVGHNKDRVQLTAAQIHYGELAAGDEDAQTIDQVCKRSGVVIVRHPPGNGIWNLGETQAIAAIRTLVNKRGAMGARKVLEVLVNANCAPVRAEFIKAVDVLLHDSEYAESVQAPDLSSVVMKLGYRAELEAKIFAAAHKTSSWRGLVVVLFKGLPKRGRRTAA